MHDLFLQKKVLYLRRATQKLQYISTDSSEAISDPRSHRDVIKVTLANELDHTARATALASDQWTGPMDGNTNYPLEGEEQAEHHHPTDPSSRSLRGRGQRRSSSVSSLDDQDSALRTDADEPPSSDMESAGDAYRRRKAQLMVDSAATNANGKIGRKQSRRHHHASDDKNNLYSSDDGQGSEYSSISTSDNVELSHMTSEDALTDDEETGLTKKDKEHRKRKRRRNTRLAGRIAGNTKSSKQERKIADRNVIKAMIINVILILSWYIFSLSISIVGQAILKIAGNH